MSAFKKLQGKIERKEKLPASRAAAIAASIGRKKYGQAGMTRKAEAGRKGKK